jgi:cytochrome c-type biogenesis protein CcmE
VQVSRSRRRTVRFTIALTLAVFLSGALVYTTFSAASPERFPDQIAVKSDPAQTYRVGGRVLASSREGSTLTMTLGHPGTGKGKPIEVVYHGTVPDPYRVGRDILIDVRRGTTASPTTFVGQGNSLVTKCPSKFNGEPMNPAGGGPASQASSVADQASAAS